MKAPYLYMLIFDGDYGFEYKKNDLNNQQTFYGSP